MKQSLIMQFLQQTAFKEASGRQSSIGIMCIGWINEEVGGQGGRWMPDGAGLVKKMVGNKSNFLHRAGKPN